MKKRSPQELEQLRHELFLQLDNGELTLAEASKKMRNIVGKSQADYAKWLNIAPRTLIDLEREVGNPTLETLNKLAKPFGLVVMFGRRQRLSTPKP